MFQQSNKLHQADVATNDAPQYRNPIHPVLSNHPAEVIEKSCARPGGAKVLNLNNPAVAGCHGIRNQHWMAGGDGEEAARQSSRPTYLGWPLSNSTLQRPSPSPASVNSSV